jgi:hypothetical protein
MPTKAAKHDDPPDGEQEQRASRLPRRPLLDEELELERRSQTWFRAAERGGLQWRRRPPNQRYVAHRRGDR